jgi:hypothetical protein
MKILLNFVVERKILVGEKKFCRGRKYVGEFLLQGHFYKEREIFG